MTQSNSAFVGTFEKYFENFADRNMQSFQRKTDNRQFRAQSEFVDW